MTTSKQRPGTERYRDERREEEDDRPKVAGHAHWSDDPKRAVDEEDVEDAAIESGGDHAGMGRGEKARKTKDREP